MTRNKDQTSPLLYREHKFRRPNPRHKPTGKSNLIHQKLQIRVPRIFQAENQLPDRQQATEWMMVSNAREVARKKDISFDQESYGGKPFHDSRKLQQEQDKSNLPDDQFPVVS